VLFTRSVSFPVPSFVSAASPVIAPAPLVVEIE
jgi:hypothetical protein